MKFTDLIANPDGTGSTKRTAGWLLILNALLFGWISAFLHVNADVFYLFFSGSLAGGLSCFGLTSFDTTSYFKIQKKKHKQDKLHRLHQLHQQIFQPNITHKSSVSHPNIKVVFHIDKICRMRYRQFIKARWSNLEEDSLYL